jgi:hypothetical protein
VDVIHLKFLYELYSLVSANKENRIYLFSGLNPWEEGPGNLKLGQEMSQDSNQGSPKPIELK